MNALYRIVNPANENELAFAAAAYEEAVAYLDVWHFAYIGGDRSLMRYANAATRCTRALAHFSQTSSIHP